MAMKNQDKIIKAYALKNALAYKGKANPGAVVSALFNEGLKKSEVKGIMPKINKAIKEISLLSLNEQEKLFDKLKKFTSEREIREGLPEIPNTEKGVIMRIAPSPSGAMHIGHALTASISYDYVKKYGGKMIVRVEDTNPDNIYTPAYDLLKKDANWLFEGNFEYFIQSDRMDLYYKYAKKLIKLNAAYICTCEAENFKKLAENKTECPCRKKTIIENQTGWKKMFDKKGYNPGEVVLRFKTPDKYDGMKNKNPAMRDFPLARVNTNKHPRQKNKYRVWPLMNLSVTADDIEMKLTHIIRAKDHMDNARRQKMMFEVLKKEYPWEAYLGKWHIVGLKLSSSQITKDIEAGIYTGWDDKKLPTLQSLMKQGYTPKAFHKIAEQRGLSEVDKKITKKEFFELLNNFNK